MFRECPLRVAVFGALGVLLLGLVTARAQSAAPSARKQTTTVLAKKSQPKTTNVRSERPQLEPKAIEVLKAVTDRLAAVHTLSFVALITSESLGRQETRLVSRNRSEVTLQRPDKLRVISSGDGPRSQVYCNGRTMMTYSPAEAALVIDKAPPRIIECLKNAYKASAIDFPSVDLILVDPSSDLISGLKHAHYVGQSEAFAGRTPTSSRIQATDCLCSCGWVSQTNCRE